MSNFAIIPWSKDFSGDVMFDVNSNINRDFLLNPYYDMKREFERLGHTIHTIDLYDNLEEIDYYLFFSFQNKIYLEIVKKGRSERMVYCTAEPPSVCRYNTAKGYKILKHIFPYIMTWNDDWVDNECIFKRNIPYFFEDLRKGNKPFGEKTLLTSISGNKKSNYPGELYSERLKAINYFEKNHPMEFEFYGMGWDPTDHPCYRGCPSDKSSVFHKYKFALCYENMEGLKGYVTEKILDCIVSGVIPVYAGATDISRYVPKGCFINLRDFKNYKELYEYISSVDEYEYNGFLNNADTFLKSSSLEYFSGKEYAHCILDALAKQKPEYKSSLFAYRVFKILYEHTR